MSVTALTITQTSPLGWRLAFTSDDATPTFYIWRDGALLGTTPLAYFDVVVPIGTHPVFAVYDDADESPLRSYPAALTLQWRRDTAAETYLVEHYDGAEWDTVATVHERGERGYYQWTTPPLADAATHQYRVSAVASDGNTSTATALSALMVRHPDPVAVTITYSSDTTKLTITEA